MNEFNRGYSMGYQDALDELNAFQEAQQEMITKFIEVAKDDVEE